MQGGGRGEAVVGGNVNDLEERVKVRTCVVGMVFVACQCAGSDEVGAMGERTGCGPFADVSEGADCRVAVHGEFVGGVGCGGACCGLCVIGADDFGCG